MDFASTSLNFKTFAIDSSVLQTFCVTFWTSKVLTSQFKFYLHIIFHFFLSFFTKFFSLKVQRYWYIKWILQCSSAKDVSCVRLKQLKNEWSKTKFLQGINCWVGNAPWCRRQEVVTSGYLHVEWRGSKGMSPPKSLLLELPQVWSKSWSKTWWQLDRLVHRCEKGNSLVFFWTWTPPPDM